MNPTSILVKCLTWLNTCDTRHSSEDREFFQEVERTVQGMSKKAKRFRPTKVKGDRKLLFSRSVQNPSQEIKEIGNGV